MSAGEMLVLQWRNPGGGEMLASVRSSREPPKSGRRIGPTHPRSANTLRHHLEACRLVGNAINPPTVVNGVHYGSLGCQWTALLACFLML